MDTLVVVTHIAQTQPAWSGALLQGSHISGRHSAAAKKWLGSSQAQCQPTLIGTHLSLAGLNDFRENLSIPRGPWRLPRAGASSVQPNTYTKREESSKPSADTRTSSSCVFFPFHGYSPAQSRWQLAICAHHKSWDASLACCQTVTDMPKSPDFTPKDNKGSRSLQ